MKNLLAVGALILVVVIASYIGYLRWYNQPALRHIHAGFLVFVDGKQQDFSGVRYMSLEPCKANKGRLSESELAHEMAHLHDNNGYVVHSHREGAVWGDLFRNIQYPFDSKKPRVAYVNGAPVQNIFTYPIHAYDSVVILVGTSNPQLVSRAITRKQIKQVEQNSADCGS